MNKKSKLDQRKFRKMVLKYKSNKRMIRWRQERYSMFKLKGKNGCSRIPVISPMLRSQKNNH